MAFFFFFQTPLLYLFGASSNTIRYASTYISIYLVGTVFVELAVGLNTFISCQGHARTAMCSVLIGAVINIGLDPVFIFVLHMGVSGAALATILSQALSAAWVLRFLTSKKSGVRLSLRTMKPDFSILGSVMALGISPFIMSATESAITIVMNHGLQTYGGDLYVGSMTILQSVLQLIFVPVNGFTNGVQPIISYNFGAGQFDRVRQTIRRMIAITFTAAFVYVVFAMLRPALFAGLFTTDPELIVIVEKVLPVYIAGMAIFGLQSGVQSSFLGLGQAKISLFIALLRKVILLIPLALILPHFFGVMGVYYAEPIADVCSVITAVTLFLCNIRKILSTETLAKVTHTEE
jgi:putative MATE family efflux protein